MRLHAKRTHEKRLKRTVNKGSGPHSVSSARMVEHFTSVLQLLYLFCSSSSSCKYQRTAPAALFAQWQEVREHHLPLPQHPKKQLHQHKEECLPVDQESSVVLISQSRHFASSPTLVLLLRSPFTWLLFGHFILLEDRAKWHIDKKSGKRCAKYLRHLQDRPVESATKCCHQVLLLASNAFLS